MYAYIMVHMYTCLELQSLVASLVIHSFHMQAIQFTLIGVFDTKYNLVRCMYSDPLCICAGRSVNCCGTDSASQPACQQLVILPVVDELAKTKKQNHHHSTHCAVAMLPMTSVKC